MPAQDSWRARLEMAHEWRDVVNKHGGYFTVTHLPEKGIKGNIHFQLSDLNNVQTALDPHIQSGGLREVLTDYATVTKPVSILLPDRRYLSPKARVFIDWFSKIFATKFHS